MNWSGFSPYLQNLSGGKMSRFYPNHEERKCYEEGREAQRLGRYDYDHSEHSRCPCDQAYFYGRRDERRAEENRREEWAQEEREERRAYERRQEQRAMDEAEYNAVISDQRYYDAMNNQQYPEPPIPDPEPPSPPEKKPRPSLLVRNYSQQ